MHARDAVQLPSQHIADCSALAVSGGDPGCVCGAGADADGVLTEAAVRLIDLDVRLPRDPLPDRRGRNLHLPRRNRPQHLPTRPPEEYRSLSNRDVRTLVEENASDAVDEVFVGHVCAPAYLSSAISVDAAFVNPWSTMLTRSHEAEVFGSHLGELRTARELTQSQLADRCRSNVPFISNLQRGMTAPSLAMMLRLAERRECRVVDLVEVVDRGPRISPKSRKDRTSRRAAPLFAPAGVFHSAAVRPRATLK